MSPTLCYGSWTSKVKKYPIKPPKLWRTSTVKPEWFGGVDFKICSTCTWERNWRRFKLTIPKFCIQVEEMSHKGEVYRCRGHTVLQQGCGIQMQGPYCASLLSQALICAFYRNRYGTAKPHVHSCIGICSSNIEVSECINNLSVF